MCRYLILNCNCFGGNQIITLICLYCCLLCLFPILWGFSIILFLESLLGLLFFLSSSSSCLTSSSIFSFDTTPLYFTFLSWHNHAMSMLSWLILSSSLVHVRISKLLYRSLLLLIWCIILLWSFLLLIVKLISTWLISLFGLLIWNLLKSFLIN